MVCSSAGCRYKVGHPVSHLNLPVDRRRIKIVKHGEIKAKSCNPCRLIICFNSCYLFFHNVFQFVRCGRLFLPVPFISDNAAGRLPLEKYRSRMPGPLYVEFF